MKTLIIVICLFAAGCSTAKREVVARLPLGTLFAEIRLTEGAFFGVEKGRSGFFFYVEEDNGIAGPRLTGYRYKHDSLVGVLGGGSDSRDTVFALRAIGFEPFDYAAEVKSCEARIQAEAKARGEQVFAPFVLDGAEYEIVIVTQTGRFTLREWNPRVSIDYYAQHSEKIAKLKAVLDILAKYYGLLEFGI
jgi:hypothetical protein